VLIQLHVVYLLQSLNLYVGIFHQGSRGGHMIVSAYQYLQTALDSYKLRL
jgi:hypothetical membrane protein